MFHRDKRRFLDGKPIDATAASTTVVGEGTVVVGDMVASGDAVVGGEIRGKFEAKGRMHLTSTGAVRGTLVAGDAKLEGAVEGPVVVSGKLEIGVTARVHGDVRAARLAIAEGSLVQGNLHTETAPQRFVESRGGPSSSEKTSEEAAATA